MSLAIDWVVVAQDEREFEMNEEFKADIGERKGRASVVSGFFNKAKKVGTSVSLKKMIILDRAEDWT